MRSQCHNLIVINNESIQLEWNRQFECFQHKRLVRCMSIMYTVCFYMLIASSSCFVDSLSPTHYDMHVPCPARALSVVTPNSVDNVKASSYLILILSPKSHSACQRATQLESSSYSSSSSSSSSAYILSSIITQKLNERPFAATNRLDTSLDGITFVHLSSG